MKLTVKKGRTSLLVKLFIQDSSKTDGSGLTGLAFNTSGLVCYRARDDDGNAGGTAITLATATLGTWATGGFKEKDATHMPGVYEFGIPNAAIASGSETAVIMLSGAANMAPVVLEIQLVAYDPQDGVALGLTALPAVAAGAANGLIINGANTGPMSISGGVTFSNSSGDALALTSSGGNGNGLNATGQGSGDGIAGTGGSTGRGLHVKGGATAEGIRVEGGATSGDGIKVTTTNGHGINLAPVGAGVHGLFATGGNSGTCDGIHASAGTGGVDIRGNITGNLHGTLDTLTTYTGNTPQGGDAYARLGAPVGASVSADIAAVKTDTDAIPNANANADALLDRSAGVETGLTPRQFFRLAAAAMLGKASGLNLLAPIYRDTNDSKNRIVAVADSYGNRTSVTLDAS